MNKLFILAIIFITPLFMYAQSEPVELSDDSLNDTGPQDQAKSEEKSKSAPVSKKSGPGNVLDFEGEVIEGERRRPDLFLQMSIDNVKFDSLIYQRDDFNDYLDVDRKSRSRYIKLK